MRLRFANHRVLSSDDLPEPVRRTVGVHAGARVEVVDVESAEGPAYVAYFSEGGSAAILDLDGACVFRAAQHGAVPGSDPLLGDAIRAAYEDASPRIEQSISFAVPRDATHASLGILHYDDETDCWYADARGVRFWVSGDGAPDPRQLRIAEAIAGNLDACVRAVAALAPGARLREIELWKADTLIAHLDGAPGKLELAWPLA